MNEPLASVQADFAAALRDRSPDAVPEGFSEAASRRFRVYRNNVRVALIEALAAAYPAVLRLVGEPFFNRMAGAFAAAEPARERTLNFYGEGFANFIAGFAPARELPYLADVAQLERAVLGARHAADAAALDPAEVAALGPGISSARMIAHPATRLVRSEYPIADIWYANAGDAPSAADLVFAEGPAGALVLRPDLSVSVEALAPGRYAFVKSLLAGADLTAAHSAAASLEEGFDVMLAFRDLLSAGAFAGVADEPKQGER